MFPCCIWLNDEISSVWKLPNFTVPRPMASCLRLWCDTVGDRSPASRTLSGRHMIGWFIQHCTKATWLQGHYLIIREQMYFWHKVPRMYLIYPLSKGHLFDGNRLAWWKGVLVKGERDYCTNLRVFYCKNSKNVWHILWQLLLKYHGYSLMSGALRAMIYMAFWHMIPITMRQAATM